MKKAPLQKVFTEIRRQTGYMFAYAEADLAKSKPVTLSISNTRITEALDMLFADQPYTYTIIERVVTLKLKTEKKIIQEPSSLSPLPIDVYGKVLNEEGDPVIGVTVQVKGTNNITVTNEEGVFTLKKVESDAILVLTAVNILRMEEGINNRRSIEFKVKGKTGKLDEVQVIAYGKTSQRYNTGNVTSVKADDIEKQPVQNPLLALQGRVPGLEVTQTTGVNGGGIKIRIQGQNSISYGLDPLIVVDGVPYPTQLQLNESVIENGSPLNYINPTDIESIDVLKDADATAIYGSRAANGAILITTKRGIIGKTKVNLNLQQGWGTVGRKVDMLNTRQYLDMRYEAYRNDGINWALPSVTADDLKLWDTTRYTDWQKELIGGTASYTNMGLSVSGGTSAMQYLIGATFNRTTTVYPGDFADKKGTLHFNIGSTSSNQRLRIQLSGSYMVDNNHLPKADLTSQALLLEPNAPTIFNPDGTLNWAINAAGSSTWANPLSYILYRDFDNKAKNLFSSATISYQLFRGLVIKSSLGYTNLQVDNYSPWPLAGGTPENQATGIRRSNLDRSTQSSWIIEPQINYVTDIGKSKIDLLVGSSIQQSENGVLSIEANGFSSDQLLKNLSAASTTRVTSSQSIYKYNALFGRFNYRWDNKYILNLNIRRDGSSRFGDKSKFHDFGSAGLAWIFSQENFIKRLVPFLSYGKLRCSYGTTGSDQIPDYSYLSQYLVSSSSTYLYYQNLIGLRSSGLSDPYLEWEETKKLQLGLELGFFRDRLLINATWARNRSSNQLLFYELPSTTGAVRITTNFPATVQNMGWELTLTSTNIQRKDFSWKSNLNITFPRNKLIAFPNLEKSSYSQSLVVGQPIDIQKQYRYSGVDTYTGTYVLANKDGNPASVVPFSESIDMSLFSRYYGGLQNAISFKDFQFDFLFQFVRQIGSSYYYNRAALPGRFTSGLSNQPVSILNRWQKPGDITSIAKFSATTSTGLGARANSVAGYTYDASYVRLKNLSIYWQMPISMIRKIKLQSFKIFFQAQNLLTFSKYSWLDPETKSNSLPPLRMLTTGINLGF
ncbi:MAG: SusC/RagA family TonB-linked outer membrane protein [Chitinophagaceae bacterium]|nr:SusC/RagA family TonB-linked outer membrane protein [Chitinophagaceae bacterium]